MVRSVVYDFVVLNMFKFSLIASALPMLVDMLLDYYMKVRFICALYFIRKHTNYKFKGISISDMWAERFWFLLNLIVPSISFLVFHKLPYMPGFYIIQQLTQQLVMYGVMITAGTFH